MQTVVEKHYFYVAPVMFAFTARFEWRSDDPEIVSDVLFAVANVLSIARTTYLMPAFEVLGTLQISLGRMIGDIKRFLVLFTLVSTKLHRKNFVSLKRQSGLIPMSDMCKTAK
jgi:hypothetical protein